jgi:hypothetical protein
MDKGVECMPQADVKAFRFQDCLRLDPLTSHSATITGVLIPTLL